MPQTHYRSRSSPDRAENLAVSIALAIRHVLLRKPQLLAEIERIAFSRSPSSAFREAALVAAMHGLPPTEQLGFAKLTRWIAVIRRDEGEQRAREVLDRIAAMLLALSNQPQSQHRAPATQQAPQVPQQQAAQQPQRGVALHAVATRGIVPGIYRYGSYDWLAEVRIERISELLRRRGIELPEELHQLAIEIFHSMYLLNTSLATERVESSEELKAIAEFTEPIRSDRALRSQTVLDEFVSLVLTARIMETLVEEMKRVAQSNECRCGKPVPCLCELGEEERRRLREAVLRVVREFEEREADKAKKIGQVIEAFSRKAGVGHRIDFVDKVEIYEILRKHPVMVDKVLEAIRSLSEERGRLGGTIEFAGYKRMETYAEIPRTRLIEYAYPETVFLKKLATKELQVREYREGYGGGRKRRYIVLIDKSGSMGGEKIEWAKAVALALLLHPDTEDVKVAFFDSSPYPEHEPISLADDPVNALRKVAGVVAGGGTCIDAALRYADEKAPGYDIVLITDGEDRVSYRPRNRLISVMIYGDNRYLKEISSAYISVDQLRGNVVRNIADST